MMDSLFNVEAIREHRIHEKTLKAEFHLKWEGYPEEDNTWEPLENMYHCMPQILAFEKAERVKLCNLARNRLSDAALAKLAKFPVNVLNKIQTQNLF